MERIGTALLSSEMTKYLGENRMGGYGSGRVGERELITNLRFLNVRWLNKQGLLKSKELKRSVGAATVNHGEKWKSLLKKTASG